MPSIRGGGRPKLLILSTVFVGADNTQTLYTQQRDKLTAFPEEKKHKFSRTTSGINGGRADDGMERKREVKRSTNQHQTRPKQARRQNASRKTEY